jgi:lipid-binding SYLF domain-containing protein
MIPMGRRFFTSLLLAGIAAIWSVSLAGTAAAADDLEIDALAKVSVEKLYAENGAARELAEKAVAKLVFPKITKAGLGVGGEVGKGVLQIGDAKDGYYRTLSVSFGAQAGFQTYGYVILFMTQSALDNFKSKKGFELGVDGSVAVIDTGATVEVDTTNIKDDTIAFVFDESGLMASATIEGSKITRLDD